MYKESARSIGNAAAVNILRAYVSFVASPKIANILYQSHLSKAFLSTTSRNLRLPFTCGKLHNNLHRGAMVSGSGKNISTVQKLRWQVEAAILYLLYGLANFIRPDGRGG